MGLRLGVTVMDGGGQKGVQRLVLLGDVEVGHVAEAALEAGVITRNIGEAVCFCPPLIITAAQIKDMFECVRQALDKVAERRD